MCDLHEAMYDLHEAMSELHEAMYDLHEAMYGFQVTRGMLMGNGWSPVTARVMLSSTACSI